MNKRKRQKQNKEFKFEDFKAVLALPERLAIFLRLWFHIEKPLWDFALDKLRQGKPYKEWSKSKGRGKGRRHFAAPCEELKSVQKKILNHFLTSIPVHCCRHGNQTGSSIITNAEHHRGAKAVYSVDIINAFPTVFRSRIRANLKKPFEFGLRQFKGVEFNEEDRKALLESLVDLICLHDRLPQGPPTSPRILDIVCMKMDQQLFELLQASSTPFQSYKLTAWADDITISCNEEIPEEIQKKVLEIVKENGFIPHTRKDKTEYFSPQAGKVPVVTGIVINQQGTLTMAPNKVNQLRARLTTFFRRPLWDSKTQGEVNGTLGYIRQIYSDRLPSKLREPVTRCETRLALMKLASDAAVPQLAEVDPQEVVDKIVKMRGKTSKPKVRSPKKAKPEASASN